LGAVLGLLLLAPGAHAAISFSAHSYDSGNYGSGWPEVAAVGDFNNDGHADAAIGYNSSPGKVAVLLGDGAGALGTAHAAADSEDSIEGLAVGDFNKDGKLDLVAAHYPGTKVSVLMGNGDGTFATAVTYTGAANSFGVAVGDFNEDGYPDIANTGSGGGFAVMLNKKDGTFGTAVSYTTPHAPGPISTADTNHDGHLDLLVGEDNAVYLVQGDGAGAFTAAGEFPLASGGGNIGEELGIGDLNGDTRPDVIAPRWNGSVSVFLNSGSGGSNSFGTATSNTASAGAARVADFNGDGKQDVAISNWSSSGVGLLPGDGAGGLGALEGSSSSSNGRDLQVADFNEDGKPDLVTAGSGSKTADVFLNTTSVAVPTNSSKPTVPSSEQQGVQARANSGAWTGSPSSYDYQWVRCDSDGTSNCADITTNGGAQNYTPVAADVGHTLKVRVVAHNTGGASSPATSDPSGVVTAAPASAPTNSSPPSVPDDMHYGQPATADPGAWTGSPSSFDYQWKKCDFAGHCFDLPGETSRNYTPDPSHVSWSTLAVQVVAHNAAGVSAPATSDSKPLRSPNGPPEVKTLAPTFGLFSGFGFSLAGQVNPNGQDTEGGFDIGSNASGSYAGGGINSDIWLDTQDHTFTSDSAWGWDSPGKWYHYRAVARNRFGEVSYGADVAFRVPPRQPTLYFNSPLSVTGSTLTWTSNIDPGGATAWAWLTVRPKGSNQVLERTTKVNVGSDSSRDGHPQTFHAIHLQPDTDYSISLNAQNSAGLSSTGYDITTPAPPSVTKSSLDLHARSADLSALVNAHHRGTTVTVLYGTTRNHYSRHTVPHYEGATDLMDHDLAFNESLGSLTPGTTYHYRISASNTEGATHTADASFTTASVAPASLAVRNGQLAATVRCLTSSPCSGAIALQLSSSTAATSSAKRPTRLGVARFRIRAKRHATVRVRLTRRGRRLARHLHGHRVVEVIRAKAGHGKAVRSRELVRVH
jgi:hypothetical protein